MNSEICQRSSYQIVSRCGRNYGEHGGVLIISDYKNLTISDLSIPDFPFSVACVVPSNTSLIFFLLIYNPDSNSRYHESIGTLTACLSAYSHYLNRFLHLRTMVQILMFSFWVILIYLVLIGKEIQEQRHSKELS